ncbi:dTDP-4-dehydrorhamnose 3,5-epimerase [Gaetbulibacter saemankumensis]|uniref:dTDP-4-dehydrorhamnose 3,5-epimerase n=1 Tax=Gaetbulibacter saemankumensis TaxID=311208 RepID=UPI00040FD2CB|nr:dTDP-4-dehydrorhamnose 3,5-epimerase [Gaetbulibacter saemankumensis]
MKVEESNLKGCYVLTPQVLEDERGYFFESFNAKVFKALTGQEVAFVQDNQSQSSKGVLRGLHYQTGAHAQAKLVRVIKGKVLDVCVDLREDSETYGKHFSVILDNVKHQQLFIPKGFAHGFVVLEDDTLFSYKCDAYYNKASEAGILYNDKDLNIDWGFSEDELIVSEKDLLLPELGAVKL